MPRLHKKMKKGRPYYYVREMARIDGKPKVTNQVYLGSPERIMSLATGAESALEKIQVQEFGALWLANLIDQDVGIAQIVDAVYDADLKGYFDSIPHDKLMACLRMRIVDRSVLDLIRMWLRSPVVETSQEKGEPSRTFRPKQGTPQGGVISPLLANIYLHWFDKAFCNANGPVQWAGNPPAWPEPAWPPGR